MTLTVWICCSGDACFTFWQCVELQLLSLLSLSSHPTHSQSPVACKVATLGLVWPQQCRKHGSGQLVLLCGTRGCHAFNSLSHCLFHYKPWGSRRVQYASVWCILPVFPTGFWKHFVHLLMLSSAVVLYPPTLESFLFIISSDSGGNDGESQKTFCQFLSVWQYEWSWACEEQELFFMSAADWEMLSHMGQQSSPLSLSYTSPLCQIRGR